MAKLNEADLVNSTHKERLSPKNGEPSNLKGGSWETLGGPTWDNKGGADAYKINASAGVGTDSTIPKSVGAEPTHLTKTEDTEEPEVSFDGDGDVDPVDDLDKELDEFEETEPVDVDVELGDDDDENKKPFGEETDPEEKEDLKEDDIIIKKDDEPKDDEPKDDDEKKEVVKEGELPPWLKKDGDKDDEKDEKEVKEELDSEPTHIDKLKTESIKIRIKLPDAKLFESVNMSAKTQKKVGVVFEQAIRNTTKQISTQLAAHYKKLHESKIAARDAVMAKQMDSYLSYVVEEWVKANKVTIRESLRAQLAEEFLDGLKKLFTEHYIDVPESKLNVVEKLTEDVKKLRRALNEEHAKKLKLHKLAEATNKARIVAESSKGLSTNQAAKLQKLAEGTAYTSAKDFREKVGLLKESYFAQPKPELKRLPDENVQEEVKSKPGTVSADPDVNAIAQSLSRQANASKW